LNEVAMAWHNRWQQCQMKTKLKRLFYLVLMSAHLSIAAIAAESL
jgi:hypothetical protein